MSMRVCRYTYICSNNNSKKRKNNNNKYIELIPTTSY